MSKPTREEIERENRSLTRDNNYLSLYLFDREYIDAKPIRAQYTDEKNATLIDASWYRHNGGRGAGYVVARYFSIVDGRRDGRLGVPSIHEFASLEQMGTRPPWAPFIVDRLCVRQQRTIDAAKDKARAIAAGTLRGCPKCLATDQIQRSNIVPIWEPGELTPDAFVVDETAEVEFDWEGQQPGSTYFCGACGSTFEDLSVEASIPASDRDAVVELIAEAAKSGAM